MKIPSTPSSAESLSPDAPREPKSFWRETDWVASIPFISVHIVSVIGVWAVGFSWSLLFLCVASYVLRMFAITAGYHRYFSHRTYRMGRFAQAMMAILGSTATQKGPLWWAAHHRHHHKFSDLREDIHSPRLGGFWWSHMGWILSPRYNAVRMELIPDLAKYPELRLIDRYYILFTVAYAAATCFIWGWAGLVWGYFVSTAFLWHGTFTINSLSHVFGSKRYRTGDDSRNNGLLALITLGEGWHNNHHCYMSSTRQGFFWWEIDVSYGILKGLSWVGVVSDLREPPLHLLEAKRIRAPGDDESSGELTAESSLR